jgi:hypothetical protein
LFSSKKETLMRYKISALLLLAIVTSFSIHAQEGASWKIVLNKKAVLTATAEDTVKNKITIKKDELSNNAIFKIEYNEPKNSPTRLWVRSIGLFDTLSAAVAQQDSVHTMQFYNKDLLKVLWNRKKVLIYTWAAPADKAMAAAIRIRRQHLCTIELVD